MSKWKCEICGKEFDNFHAQGFDNKIYCPLCFFKEENKQLKAKLEMYENGVYYSSENDKLKEVIEEVRGIIESGLDFDNPQYADECKKELLQILDKVKEVGNE